MGDNKIPNNIFRLSVEKACEIETSIFENRFKDTDKHTFSESYLERMQILKMGGPEEKGSKIANYSVKKKSTRVKILLIAAIVMLLGTLTVAAEPVREFIYQLKETIFPDNTEIGFEELGNRIGEEEAIVAPETFVCRKPNKVPENYKLNYEEYVEIMCDYTVSWLNQDEQVLLYQQVAIGYFDTWSITSDGNKAETIGVNGEIAYLLVDKNDCNTILYPYEGYVYALSGFEEVDILVKILQSTFEELDSINVSKSEGLEWEDFEVKEPAYIPEDYRLEVEETNEPICEFLQIYVNEQGETIVYEQKIIGQFDTWSISSDGEPAESIAVCGDRGYLITDKKNYHYIIYPCEGYVYSFASYEDVDVLVKCLESIFEE